MMWFLSVVMRIPGWFLLVAGSLAWLGDGRPVSAGTAVLGLCLIGAGRQTKRQADANRLDRSEWISDDIERRRRR